MSDSDQQIGAAILGEILGNIPDDLFRVVERGPLFLHDPRNDGVRPCDHRKYVLDDELVVVRCADCKERLEPYAVLRRYAEWFDDLKRMRDNAQHSRWHATGQRIRNMLDRSCFTEAERDDYRRRTHLYGKGALEEIQRIEKEVEDRVNAARQQRASRRVASEKAPVRPRLT